MDGVSSKLVLKCVLLSAEVHVGALNQTKPMKKNTKKSLALNRRSGNVAHLELISYP